MIRVLPVLFALLLLTGTPADAQRPAASASANAPQAAATSSAAPHPQAPAISVEQARLALDVLNDPRRRAAFVATLDAIIKAQPAGTAAGAGMQAATTPAASPPGETKPDDRILPLAADSLGAQLLM